MAWGHRLLRMVSDLFFLAFTGVIFFCLLLAVKGVDSL